MASLNHERVVKLLGVIMEDRDCSLVLELLPRGNLLVMLEKVCMNECLSTSFHTIHRLQLQISYIRVLFLIHELKD